ncbi:Activator of Hsp90 ATPase 1 family protein [Methylocella silvestris BL2]|uniref:Activator of Hsp90 ATPase 1 family protein n=1 Tax=Methylocella silvestris (strain DSM 15510 / CIP 108128 / LMG 27833 / NCIMB 13906 / BL2) TaxID=395965 RepID=B8ET95_METSB|nr:SRPBCC family protein [Methylocella silvestris]ACK51737.1 Activator of Hsp90 ATPase 1 family protein [Methylocella silvestris BL2]
MTTPPFFHGIFTIRRSWAAPPARVFKAWSDPELKSQWFTGPADRWTLKRRTMDFRAGGIEVLEGRFNQSGLETLFEARFHLIEPNCRLVYAYDLYHSGSFHSVTLSSLILEPEASGTALSYTEQIVFLDGKDGTESRRHGTALQFDMIENTLQLNGVSQ